MKKEKRIFSGRRTDSVPPPVVQIWGGIRWVGSLNFGEDGPWWGGGALTPVDFVRKMNSDSSYFFKEFF